MPQAPLWPLCTPWRREAAEALLRRTLQAPTLPPRQPLDAAMGDAALYRCREAQRHWEAPYAQWREVLTSEGHPWGLLDDAVSAGLLVAHEGRLRFASPELAVAASAQRLVDTEDARQDLQQRLRGRLFDVVAWAVAIAPQGEALTEELVNRGGPFEDLLQLGALQAAHAVALGATTSEALLQQLCANAVAWTNPGAESSFARVGAALLCQAALDARSSETVATVVTDRLAAFHEAGVRQDTLACLRHTLWIACQRLLAADAPAETLAALYPMGLRWVAEGVALGARDEAQREALVVELLTQAAERREPEAALPLVYLAEIPPQVMGLIRAWLEEDEDHAALCVMLAERPHLPEAVHDLLMQRLLGRCPAPMRVGVAQALWAHLPPGMEDDVAVRLASRAKGTTVAEKSADVVTALLLLPPNPERLAEVMPLVAAGVPAEVFASGLLRQWSLAPLAFADEMARLLGREDLQSTALATLLTLCPGQGARYAAGDSEETPARWQARHRLVQATLPLAGYVGDAGRGAPAALVSACFGRHFGAVADTLLALIRAAESSGAGQAYIAALGAVGAPGESLDLLAQRCAYGSEAQSANAAQALLAYGDDITAYDPMDGLVPLLAGRAGLPGLQARPLRSLLQHLATLPMGQPQSFAERDRALQIEVLTLARDACLRG